MHRTQAPHLTAEPFMQSAVCSHHGLASSHLSLSSFGLKVYIPYLSHPKTTTFVDDLRVTEQRLDANVGRVQL